MAAVATSDGSVVERRILFSVVILREIAAAVETTVDYETNEHRIVPPSVVLPAQAFVRLAGTRLAGEFDCSILASACLFAASKVAEQRLRVKDIGRAGRWVEASRRGRVQRSLVEQCEAVLEMELKLLAICGFVIPTREVHLPHRLLYCLSEVLIKDDRRLDVLRASWAYLNDAAMLNLQEEQPLDIAAACLALGAQDTSAVLPMSPLAWWDAVGANQAALERIAMLVYEAINVMEWPTWIE